MKKMIFLVVAFAAILFTTLAASAQTSFASSSTISKEEKKELRKENRKAESLEVSSRTLQQFAIDFSGAKLLSGTRTSGMDKITFTQNGVQSDAYYDNSSSLIGTITAKTVADLPAIAIKTIGKQYKGYTIGKVFLFNDNQYNESDMILYGRQFADADNYFAELNKDGKRIILQINMNGDTFYFKTL